MGMFDVTRRILVCLFVAAGAAGCAAGSSAGPLPSSVSLSPSLPASPAADSPIPAPPDPSAPVPSSSLPSSPAPSSPAPAPPSASSTRPVPPSSRALPLTLTRSGGIRGASDEITVQPDGTAVVTRDGAQPVRTKLSPENLAALRTLVADPALVREGSRGTTVCNDGYQYRLRTPSVLVTTNDCGARSRPALTKVIDLVRPLLNQ
jgi:hypothetical protein